MHEIAEAFKKPRCCVITLDAGNNQLENSIQLELGIAFLAGQRIVKQTLPEISEMIFQNSDSTRRVDARKSVQHFEALPKRQAIASAGLESGH